jgi:hypothetical protein
MAPIEMLGWSVFVEQPAAEVYAKLNVDRAPGSSAGGLVISAAAPRAAPAVVRRSRTLDEGARPIGAGELIRRSSSAHRRYPGVSPTSSAG